MDSQAEVVEGSEEKPVEGCLTLKPPQDGTTKRGWARTVYNIRQQYGLGFRQLARELGVYPCAVSQWESGKVNPSQKTQWKLYELMKRLDERGTP